MLPPQPQASPPGGAPGVPPSPGGSPTGQPPIGASPATGPTQNLGLAAKGLQAVSALLSGMAMVVPLVGPTSPIGQALTKAMLDIGKHVPPGAASQQGENNFMQQMMQKRMQMGPQNAAAASQMPLGAGAGAPPGMSLGMPPPGAAA